VSDSSPLSVSRVKASSRNLEVSSCSYRLQSLLGRTICIGGLRMNIKRPKSDLVPDYRIALQFRIYKQITISGFQNFDIQATVVVSGDPLVAFYQIRTYFLILQDFLAKPLLSSFAKVSVASTMAALLSFLQWSDATIHGFMTYCFNCLLLPSQKEGQDLDGNCGQDADGKAIMHNCAAQNHFRSCLKVLEEP
jgi:hypothetical protein